MIPCTFNSCITVSYYDFLNAIIFSITYLYDLLIKILYSTFSPYFISNLKMRIFGVESFVIMLAFFAWTLTASDVDELMCGLIAATNIQSISDTSMWSCDANGVVSSDPCHWVKVYCKNGLIAQIYPSNIALVGKNIIYQPST